MCVLCHINILYAHKHIPALKYRHTHTCIRRGACGGNLPIQEERDKRQKKRLNIGLHLRFDIYVHSYVPEKCYNQL